MGVDGRQAEPADEALVEQARGGDHEAFARLVERHRGPVYNLALRIVGQPEAAEEVLQETFLTVYRKLDGFRGEARFSTWLYRIAMNAALMHRRASRRHQAESLEAYLPRFDETGHMARADWDYGLAARADELLERGELAARAMEALGRLPEIYRAVVVLRDLEGLSTAETAEVLGISAEVVRQRLHRARLMLRGYLGRLTGGEG